jgi:hypothetical protein
MIARQFLHQESVCASYQYGCGGRVAGDAMEGENRQAHWENVYATKRE